MGNMIVEGHQSPAPPARQPLPMTARVWIETCCLNCQNPSRYITIYIYIYIYIYNAITYI